MNIIKFHTKMLKNLELPKIERNKSQIKLVKQPQSPYYKIFQQIQISDYILIGAGAGFSVDSGLKVYKDIAKIPIYKQLKMDYADLCDPELLKYYESQQIFYGFWGTCYNDYMDTKPHTGYYLLQNMLTKLNKKHFVYTSNVDGFFKRVFNPDNVFEIHGTLMEWQCSKQCSKFVYFFDDDFRFKISENMKYEFTVQKITYSQLKDDVEINQNFDQDYMIQIQMPPQCLPKCHLCNAVLRPRVMMFDDDQYMEIDAEQQQFEDFRRLFLKSKCCTMLEFGCGLRVPTIREDFERWLRKRLQKGKQCQLIRINPGEEKLQKKTNIYRDSVRHIKVGAEQFLRELE
uniref:Sir2 family protein n=1 Tax=Trepomonas sp. PC1 TaxID=1076344 RepID=A0A146K276_9EUKA|eukprot:JAP90992.1 Sir2 family protein [Trepomonas sp. PC1]